MSDATGTQDAGGLRDHYELLHDVSPADWIAPRLTSPPFRRVDGTVPGGFAAYARVLHPASTPDGRPVGWAAVAAERGTPWHPLVRWTDLVPESADGAGWQGREPEQGCLPPAALAALARALGPFTAEPEACLCCLWEGWGWLHGSPSVARYGSDEP
ncbi:MAG: hypothetical protein ACXVFV_01510, partial [Mycobacteriales bacterium]